MRQHGTTEARRANDGRRQTSKRRRNGVGRCGRTVLVARRRKGGVRTVRVNGWADTSHSMAEAGAEMRTADGLDGNARWTLIGIE